MNAKRPFTKMVIAVILFTFAGAAYVAADSDKKGRMEGKSDKSIKIQSETDSMKSGSQATMGYNNKSVLKKSCMVSDLIGMTIKSKQNEDLGEVQDLIFNESGRIQYMVISRGGILGVGDDRIPIPFNDAKVDSENKIVTLDQVDKQMLSNAPKFTDDDWKNVGDPRFDEKMRSYYGDDFSDDYAQMNRMNQGNRMKQDGYDQEKMKTEQKPTRNEKMGRESGKQENLTNYRPLVDRTVRNSRGEDISDIENVLVSEDGSQVKAVLSVGGFLGIGDKKVLIGMNELQFDPNTDYVTYRGTEEDLENRMEYEEPEDRREYATRPYAAYGPGGYYGSRPGEYPADRYGYEDERYRGYYPESDRYGREYEGRYRNRFPSGEDRYSDREYYEEQRQSGRRYGEDRYQDQDRYHRYPSRQEGYEARYDQRQQGMYYQPRYEERMDGRYDTRQQERYQSREDYERQSQQGYDESRQSGRQQQQ